MKFPLPDSRRSLWVSLIIGWMPAMVAAQLISMKTVPVATGDQFLVFPSRNLAMGGISIALEDSLMDPFVNPSKGGLLRGNNLILSPAYYRISDESGSAKTLPLGTLYGSDHWFWGLSLSLQEIETPLRPGGVGTILGRDRLLGDTRLSNFYVFAIAGQRLEASNVSLGASIFWADLNALQGVTLLYPGSDGVEQFGYMVDYRLGAVKNLESGGTVEFLVLLNRLNMTHNVTYITSGWEWWTVRKEKNLDQTDTWGVHFRYVRPPAEAKWRTGLIFTANRKTHPKIPNYELMNIPRDPGDSWAYNVGLGLSLRDGEATVGLDLIYEPIWSHTWAEAADTVLGADNGIILLPGEKTVDNRFRFSNSHVRIGVSREDEKFGFQLGLQAYSVRYHLSQYDFLEKSGREQEEGWIEWTPTWGLTFKFPEFSIHYLGRWTLGTGQPGVAGRWGVGGARTDFNVGGDIILAPSGDLTLREATVLTQQVSISVPLR